MDLILLCGLIFAQAAIAARPDPVTRHNQAVLKQARMFYEFGHTAEARRLIEPLCFCKETTAPMYCLLAEAYIDDYSQNPSDSKKIVSILQAAIKLDPSSSVAYKDMAEFCNVEGQYQKAVEYGLKSLQCPHPYLGTYRQTAIAYSNLGQYDKALAAINTFINLDKTRRDQTYTMKAGILEKMKRYDDAVAAYRQAFALRSDDMTLNSIVRCLEAEHKFAEAVSEISRLIKINPNDSEALAVRAKLQKTNKNYGAALDDYSKAINIDPSARLYKARADIYLLIGQKLAADRDLASARKADASKF